MVCIYHNRDLDGYTSGAIVLKKYPNAKMVGYDYGQPIPWDEIPWNQPIIMVDVSFDMESMLLLNIRSGGNLTWIDHHISAQREYIEFKDGRVDFLNFVFDNSIAACEGTWKHLFPDKNMPLAVQLLGAYDTWRNDDERVWQHEILPFQFGMRTLCNSPETFPSYLFDGDGGIDEDDVWDIVEQGKGILKYLEKTNATQCEKNAFEFEFKGFRAICLNGGGFNSDVFKSVWDEEKYDIMMPFQFNGKYWTFSLYTSKDGVDCSTLAKSMGGGGHKKAAGFQVVNLEEVFGKA